MPGIVEFPRIVESALVAYGDIFANEAQRRHFAEYLTGLLVALRKTVLGIHGEFAETTDQSSLNRFMTQYEWDTEKLNDRRLEKHQEDPTTRYSKDGVIPLDNTLVDHDGKLIEDVGWFWDHAEQRHKIAHDYLILNYVSTSGKHFPLHFRRFRKEDQCQENAQEFKKHTALAIELIDWLCRKGIPGALAWDNYFSAKEILNHAHDHGRAYVGDLKANRNIVFRGKELKASQLAQEIPIQDRKEVILDGRRQWYFTKTVKLPGVDHKVRLTILWDGRRDREPRKFLITNRTFWNIRRILRVYRKRWTGTETFHRDAKQHLGMGDCQLRDGKGQTRHMHLVFLAYSLLMTQLRSRRSQEWTPEMLKTIGQACRAVLRETLGTTIEWAITKFTSENWTLENIKIALALA